MIEPALRGLRRLLMVAALTGSAACGPAGGSSPREADTASAPGSVVILLYHHVSGDTPASTSVQPATFAAHLDYLVDQDYQVVPLSQAMAALSGNGELPERAVAITFDDAYRSVFTEAAPRLRQRDMPFTVFISTDYIDQQLQGYMSWSQLRELEATGAQMANHSLAHGHYLHRPAGESDRAWRQRVTTDIRGAQARLEAELEAPLAAIAYPYGEFSPALEEIAADLNLIGFGQQSGPAGQSSSLQSLPRFPMAGSYAAPERFAEKLRTWPFTSVTVLSDPNPVLAPSRRGNAPPTLALQLTAAGANLDALSCFVSGRPAVLNWLDRADGVVEVTATAPLPVGRSKYTCTAPAHDGGYYWYSRLWMQPPAPGAWYSD